MVYKIITSIFAFIIGTATAVSCSFVQAQPTSLQVAIDSGHDGWTTLHKAVYNNELSFVRSLLEKEGAPVDKSTTKDVGDNAGITFGPGTTALHIAAAKGFTKIARALLDAGALKNALTLNGNRPLTVATLCGKRSIVKLLIEYHVDVNDKGQRDRTALHGAMEQGDIAIGQLLIQAGADINVGDREGNTPLHKAAEHGRFEAVKFLIRNGANLHVKNRIDKTPLCLAKKGKHSAIVDLLRRSAVHECECENCLSSLDLVKNVFTGVVSSMAEYISEEVEKDPSTLMIAPFHMAAVVIGAGIVALVAPCVIEKNRGT